MFEISSEVDHAVRLERREHRANRCQEIRTSRLRNCESEVRRIALDAPERVAHHDLVLSQTIGLHVRNGEASVRCRRNAYSVMLPLVTQRRSPQSRYA